MECLVSQNARQLIREIYKIVYIYSNLMKDNLSVERKRDRCTGAEPNSLITSLPAQVLMLYVSPFSLPSNGSPARGVSIRSLQSSSTQAQPFSQAVALALLSHL